MSAQRRFLRCVGAIVAGTLAAAVAHSEPPSQRDVGFVPRTFGLINARLVISPDEEVESGTLVIRDGLIEAVGRNVVVPEDAEVIDARGMTVYAGFIDAGSSALIDPKSVSPPEAGRKVDFSRFALAATPPDNRKSLTPEFEACTALKSDAGLFETRRRLGITTVHIVPSGRIAGGFGGLVSTSGLPLRESLLVRRTMPEFQLYAPGEEGYPRTLMGAAAHLRQAFLDADDYRRRVQAYREKPVGAERPPEDLALAALADLRDARGPVLFKAQTPDDIFRAIHFAEEQNLPVAIWGGHEAHRCLDRLHSACRGVILDVDWGKEPVVEPAKESDKLVAKINDPLRVQHERRDHWRERVAGVKALSEREITFAFSSDGLKEPEDLLKAVRQTISAGLPRQAALAGLTRNAAVLLGQEARLGTLSRGKLAHVVVFNGPFDDDRSKVRFVFVDGLKYEYNHSVELVTSGSTAQADTVAGLAGKWQIQIEGAEGKLAAILDLKKSASALAGTFQSNQGEGKIAASKIDGKNVEFTVAIGVGAQSIELKFSTDTTDAAQGKLTGTLKSAFGSVTHWTGQRQAESTPVDNPVALTIEPSAREPDTAKAAVETAGTNVADGWPTELEGDRRKRPRVTGGNVLLKNAVVFTGFGEPLPSHSVLVKQGKIVAVGPNLPEEPGLTIVDCAGRFVMPGIVDTHSHIMIAAGVNESSLSVVPEVRVADALRSDDPAAYRALAGGVTTIRILHGSANVIGGQHAVVKLKYGEPLEQQLLRDAPQGIKFALGENVKAQANRFPNTRLGVEATLQRAFLEALDYRRRWQQYRQHSRPDLAANGAASAGADALPPRRDLRLEALADIIDQQKFIHSHCYRADEILMLMRVAEGFGVRVWSLQHVLEGYKVAAEIAAHGASCSTFADWWAYKMEAYDATPYNAALLREAGANIVLKSDDAELMRHLYQDAAKMVRYGNVPPDAALRMITLNGARELGLDSRIGSIETGKDADLAVFNGHPLNALARCEMTLIDGEIYFEREKQPTAMSAQAAGASAKPPVLALAPRDIRDKRLDLGLAPNRKYAIVGAMLHPVDGPDIPSGTILVDGDRITAIGAAVEVPAEAKTIDAAGLHVYPGLIDVGSVLGLIEVGRVRETHDYKESGQFQPDLRAGVAINPDSELIPVCRAGGITATLVRPTGGVICGQASLMQLDGWTVPEMLLDFELALQVDWPGGAEPQPQIDALRDFLRDGRTYWKARTATNSADAQPPLQDPRYEALGPYLRREKPVLVEANTRREIAEALLFAEKEQLKIVITGAAEGWKLADELKRRDVPVVVGPVMARPQHDYDPFDASYANAGRLHEAGVLVCIRSSSSPIGGPSASNSRNMPFEAAMAAAYGLPEAEALKSVTLNAARVLGVADRLGSLTVGKRADLLICDGSPLQPTTHYKAIFVGGRPHAPESRHTRLYEKYRGRLHEVQKRRS